MPSHLQDILDWREKGIKNVVVLTTDYEIEEVWGHVDYYFKVLEEAGIKYTWSPIKDGEAPRIGQFNEILNFIRRGGKCVVHCLAGIGRTGTILAGYLIVEEGLTPSQAVEEVRRVRPGAVQTVKQHEFLWRLEEGLRHT